MEERNLNSSCLAWANSTFLTPSIWSSYYEGDDTSIAVGYLCATVTLLYFLIGVPWNWFVIAAILLKRLYENSPSVVLLVNQAASNLLICLVVLPFTFITGFSEEFVFGSTDAARCAVCQLGILAVTLTAVSLITMSLLALDRLTYLKKPLEYSKYITTRRAFIANVLAWLFSIGISAPPFFGLGTVGFGYVISACGPVLVGRTDLAPNFYYAMFLAVFLLFPVSVMIVSYVWIVAITRKHLFRKAKYFVAGYDVNSMDEVKKKIEKENLNKQFKLVQLFGAIFIANLLTWLPIVSVAIAGAIVGSGIIPSLAYAVAYLAYFSQVVIHPVLQALLIREIKDVMAKCCVPGK